MELISQMFNNNKKGMLNVCTSSHQTCRDGHFPGKMERESEFGLCAQMVDNMGPWTTVEAYARDTVTLMHTHTHTNKYSM